MERIQLVVTGLMFGFLTSGCGSFNAQSPHTANSASQSDSSSSLASHSNLAVHLSSQNQTLTIVPSVLFGETIQVNGSGGTLPYVFSIAGCDSTIDPNSGIMTAASDVSSCQITITDAYNETAAAVINVVAPIDTPINAAPAAMTVVSGSSITITPGGGLLPYSFAVSGCSSSIDAQTGVFTADAKGPESCTVTVTDSANNSASEVIDVVGSVASAPSPSPTPAAPFTVVAPPEFIMAGVPVQLSVSGGTQPYSYSISNCGDGATISNTGLFQAGSGANASGCTVNVSDSSNQDIQLSLAILSLPFSGLNIYN